VDSRQRHRMVSRRYRRSKELFTWLAPVVALIVAVAPALASLHRALVPHLICEHGDLIEVAAEQPSPESSSFEQGQRTPRITSNSAGEVHRHDHCLLAALGRAVSAAPRNRAVFLLRSVSQVLRTHSAEPPFQHSILLFAPKTSPPAPYA
jgi:hypothetical protein